MMRSGEKTGEELGRTAGGVGFHRGNNENMTEPPSSSRKQVVYLDEIREEQPRRSVK